VLKKEPDSPKFHKKYMYPYGRRRTEMRLKIAGIVCDCIAFTGQ